MPHAARRLVPLLLLICALALTVAPVAADAATLPTEAAATKIVTRLWNQREAALTNLNQGQLGLADYGIAQLLDARFIASVQCGCAQAKAAHPIDSVQVELPASSVLPSFLAQVRTTNAADGTHPWYVVAVAREAGDWRIVFLTYAGDAAHTPLPAGPPAALTAAAHVQMTRLARLGASQDNARTAKPVTTSWGSVQTGSSKLEPGLDGVYGLAFSSGKVLSCYALHEFTRISAPGKELVQTASRAQYGQSVAPGKYRSVTVEDGYPQCMLGSGSSGSVVMDYDAETLAVTAVPA